MSSEQIKCEMKGLLLVIGAIKTQGLYCLNFVRFVERDCWEHKSFQNLFGIITETTVY